VTEQDTPVPRGEILLYQTEDGRTRIECRFEESTIWLSQALMADLFQTTVPNINLHIRNILSEGELTEAATIKDYLMVRPEGEGCHNPATGIKLPDRSVLNGVFAHGRNALRC